jgi:MerR HTH family regulatory protein
MKPARGAYTADRAAALSGVPKSTVHYWARREILVPSISPERVKLWSYPDLMGLRIIYWLRHEKTGEDGQDIPASTMPQVERVLHRGVGEAEGRGSGFRSAG